MKFKQSFQILVIIILALVISACNQASVETGIEDISQSDMVSTQAMQTAIVRMTETAEFQPTATHIPTEEPTATATLEPTATQLVIDGTATETLPPPLPTNPPGVNTPCLAASLEWENYPDYSELNASSNFDKRWRIKNIGTCTWNGAFSVVFVDGNLMNAGGIKQLTEVDVRPGDYVTIELNMTAPAEEGTYRSDWKLQASDGTIFGISPGDGTLWVIIKSIQE